mgnify:CR=1 FL=1
MGEPAKVYLGLGTNRGDRIELLRYAARELAGLLSNLQMSPVYETEPLDYTAQPRFLNAVVAGGARLSPEATLEAAQRIEAEAGRSRKTETPKGPRTLDIDILLYGTLIIDSERLTIPHPELARRAFALKPLLDLEPGCLDPRSGRPYADFLGELPDQGVYLAADNPYTSN